MPGIMTKKQAAIPPGQHTGKITAARMTNKDFGNKDENGRSILESTVEIVIAPDYKAPNGAETLPVAVVFSPVLNGLSALSNLLRRLDKEPQEGVEWQPSALVGTRVAFTSEVNKGFTRVVKDTLRAE